MNTDTLKTFVVLSDLRSYTRTANQLFVAQSTVTNRILELEQQVGRSLFIRNRKGLELTTEGKHFLRYAKRILELADCALEEISSLNHFDRTIRIGSTNTIYDCHLAGRMVPGLFQNQDVKLSVTISHSTPLIQMLQDKTIDVAFTYSSYNKNHIKCRIFAEDTLLLVTSPDHTVYKKGIRREELADIPYYYCDFTFQNLGSYIKDLFPYDYSFPLEIDRSAYLLPFLVSGMGYSFLPKSMVEDYLKSGLLIEIPLADFSVPPVNCYMLYSSQDTADTVLHFLEPLAPKDRPAD